LEILDYIYVSNPSGFEERLFVHHSIIKYFDYNIKH